MTTTKNKDTPNGTPKASSKVAFVESMECLPVIKLPQGPEWSYEIKLDGFHMRDCAMTKIRGGS